MKAVYRNIKTNVNTPYLFQRLQTLKRELTCLQNQQQAEKWNKIIEETDLENNPRQFWRNFWKLKGDLPWKRKIILEYRYGEAIENPQQIQTKFREVWKKLFQI